MSKAYVRVRNWQKFQHYRDRNPPWIKLHATTLEDEDFAALPDVAKSHLMGIWILASRLDNRIPASPDFIGKRINANEPVDLKALIEKGFLERFEDCKQLASTPQATCSTDKEESRGETETAEPPQKPPLPAVRAERQRRRGTRAEAEQLSRYWVALANAAEAEGIDARDLVPPLDIRRARVLHALEDLQGTPTQLAGSISERLREELVGRGRLPSSAPWPPRGLAPFDAHAPPGWPGAVEGEATGGGRVNGEAETAVGPPGRDSQGRQAAGVAGAGVDRP